MIKVHHHLHCPRTAGPTGGEAQWKTWTPSSSALFWKLSNVWGFEDSYPLCNSQAWKKIGHLSTNGDKEWETLHSYTGLTRTTMSDSLSGYWCLLVHATRPLTWCEDWCPFQDWKSICGLGGWRRAGLWLSKRFPWGTICVENFSNYGVISSHIVSISLPYDPIMAHMAHIDYYYQLSIGIGSKSVLRRSSLVQY